MLNLFAAVFGREAQDAPALPASLLEQLTERAVDGTDPRIRIISGYAKTLRKPVVHAASYIIGQIDSLPESLPLQPGSLRENPLLSAFLFSEADATRMLERDAALKDYRTSKPAAQAVTALLVVQRSEKRGFGYAEVGGQALQDVPRTTVSFTHHRLLEPTGAEEDTRRGMKRRAFDQLLAVALAIITERNEERTELASQRALLRSKLAIIQRSGSFAAHTAAGEQAGLQASMKVLEDKLAALGPSADTLQGNLDVLVEVLTHAERHLWLEENTLYLDKFYVLHEKPSSSAPAIVCRDLHNSEGRQATLQLVRLPFESVINTQLAKE